jgi:phage FluMu protein Com
LPFSGAKVGFKLLQGSDTATAARIAQDHAEDLASSTLLLRLAYVEGATSPGERRKFAAAMDSDDFEWLQDEWRDADLTVEDTIEVQCQRCRGLREVEIPYDARFFSRRSARPPKKSAS